MCIVSFSKVDEKENFIVNFVLMLASAQKKPRCEKENCKVHKPFPDHHKSDLHLTRALFLFSSSSP